MNVFVTGGSGFVGGALIRRLVAEGQEVCALARSIRAAEIVTARGARPVTGSLTDFDTLVTAMQGADAVVHAAARLTAGPRERQDMVNTNVTGTRTVRDAALWAGVPTFVHVSTEQVVMGRTPLTGADETWSPPKRHSSWYGATKAAAESVVLTTPADDIRAVAVRPRFVWGLGDPTLLPQLVQATAQGMFRWIDGGNHLTSTCHVDNVVEGIVCALRHGAAGEAYFLTDGPPQHFRTFVSSLLETQHVSPSTKSVSAGTASLAAAAVELAWRVARRHGPAPLDRATLAVIGRECTVDDTKARAAIHYRPAVTIEQGLSRLKASTRSDTEM